MGFSQITILGPTAAGKTRLGAELAAEFGGEIISADSRQVYCGMDIGTGKDIADYKVNGVTVPYHLIDVESPKNEYHVVRFVRDYNKAYADIRGRGKIPFLVGGTGLYLSAVLQGYEFPIAEFSEKRKSELQKKSIEELRDYLFSLKTGHHNTSDLKLKERLIRAILIAEAAENENTDIIKAMGCEPLVIGVFPERMIIKERITKRLKERLDEGMIEEAERLLAKGITHERLERFGLEYKFLSLFLRGELNYNDMYQKLNSAIYSFAKRQLSWFRKMEREGVKIHRLPGADFNTAKAIIEENTVNANER